MSKSKKEERLQLVLALYVLGLSVHEIQRLMPEWSSHTIQADLRSVKEKPRDRPKKPAVFRKVFGRYVELHNEDTGDIGALSKLLAQWLNLASVREFIDGLVQATHELIAWRSGPIDTPYVRLMMAVFGEKLTLGQWWLDLQATTIWQQYLDQMVNSRPTESPSSSLELRNALVRLVFSHEECPRSDIALAVVDGTLRDAARQALCSLTPLEEKVLRMRYGLNGAVPLTQKEVGASIFVSPERARQIEAKALRKLRHPSRRRLFETIIRTVRDLEQENQRLTAALETANRNVEVKRIEGRTILRSGYNPNLFRSVDELELSYRSTNCLQNANIKYIGDLVQKTEAELMKLKNFGRKSLKEIKEILAEMDLALGSLSPEEWQRIRPT